MQRKHYSKKHEPQDASKLKIGVVVSRFNEEITESLLEGALQTLSLWNVPEKNITVVRVPGSFEIPYGCQMLLAKKPDAVIALGCIIKGETTHDKHIAHAVSVGIMNLSLQHETPIAFGILTVNTLAQAKTRSTGKTNKGIEATEAILETALLSR